MNSCMRTSADFSCLSLFCPLLPVDVVGSPGVWLVPGELMLELCKEGYSSAASSSSVSGGAAVSSSSLGAWLVVVAAVLEVLAEVLVDGFLATGLEV